MPDVAGPPAQERSASMPETGVRRAWEGAGNHGFVYMDSQIGRAHV